MDAGEGGGGGLPLPRVRCRDHCMATAGVMTWFLFCLFLFTTVGAAGGVWPWLMSIVLLFMFFICHINSLLELIN